MSDMLVALCGSDEVACPTLELGFVSLSSKRLLVTRRGLPPRPAALSRCGPSEPTAGDAAATVRTKLGIDTSETQACAHLHELLQCEQQAASRGPSTRRCSRAGSIRCRRSSLPSTRAGTCWRSSLPSTRAGTCWRSAAATRSGLDSMLARATKMPSRLAVPTASTRAARHQRPAPRAGPRPGDRPIVFVTKWSASGRCWDNCRRICVWLKALLHHQAQGWFLPPDHSLGC